MENIEFETTKTQMDKNLDKLEKINHLGTDSFWGLLAALFVLLIYNYYSFQSFFSLFEESAPVLKLLGFFWYVVFFMVQAGILKVIYRKFSTGSCIFYSPFKSFREFFRLLLCFPLGIIFFAFVLNVYYPFKIFSTSITDLILFYVVSIGISVLYWKYVEHYNRKDIRVPKLGAYGVSGWITIIFCMLMFGTAAVFFPYTIIGFMGFGIWLIMLCRFLLEG